MIYLLCIDLHFRHVLRTNHLFINDKALLGVTSDHRPACHVHIIMSSEPVTFSGLLKCSHILSHNSTLNKNWSQYKTLQESKLLSLIAHVITDFNL